MNELNNYKYSEGLVVEVSNFIFGFLEKISLFVLVRFFFKKSLKLKYLIKNDLVKLYRENKSNGLGKYIDKNINIYIGKKMYTFVDLWVMGNLLLSMVLSYFLVNYRGDNKWYIILISIYTFMRVFEVVIYQINVNLFHLYRAKKKNRAYSIKSPTRTMVLLLHNYIELIFWFIIIAIGSVAIIKGRALPVRNWTFCVRKSFTCFVTLDYEAIFDIWFNKDFATKTRLLYVGILEVVSGLIMTVISLANFIGKLPSEYIPENKY